MTKATRAWQEATKHKYTSIVFKKLNAKERQKRRYLDKRNMQRLPTGKQHPPVDEQCSSVEVAPAENTRDSPQTKDKDASIDISRTSVNSSDTEKAAQTVCSEITTSSADVKERASLDSSDGKGQKSDISGEPVHAGVWRPNPKPVQTGVHVQFRSKTHPVHVEVGRWVPVLSHQVCHLHHSSGPKK